jgi:hypothetical protein
MVLSLISDEATTKGVVGERRFEVLPLQTSNVTLIRQALKRTEELRGSPRPAARAGGNLVGRGIANPMSERTRGFELPRKKMERNSHSPRHFSL